MSIPICPRIFSRGLLPIFAPFSDCVRVAGNSAGTMVLNLLDERLGDLALIATRDCPAAGTRGAWQIRAPTGVFQVLTVGETVSPRKLDGRSLATHGSPSSRTPLEGSRFSLSEDLNSNSAASEDRADQN